MSTKPVLITTQHRGVFAGLIPVDQDLSVKAMPLKSARIEGWERSSAKTLAAVFGVSVQRIAAIVRNQGE